MDVPLMVVTGTNDSEMVVTGLSLKWLSLEINVFEMVVTEMDVSEVDATGMVVTEMDVIEVDVTGMFCSIAEVCVQHIHAINECITISISIDNAKPLKPDHFSHFSSNPQNIYNLYFTTLHEGFENGWPSGKRPYCVPC
ncbi:hypothetical protein BgiBS90_022401 [Biomphalaria glabrata]|nr:hypothetical protein BgiBS90_022401 [Biomphalaria glabrata]